MLTRLLMLAAVAATPTLATAEDFYQPRAEIEGFYSNMKLIIGDTGFTDANGNSFELRNPKGSGGGVKLSALVLPDVTLTGEFASNQLDIDGGDAKLRADLDQYRVGVLFASRPAASDYPVYAAAGLEFARFESSARFTFAGNVTETQAGEDPTADPDTVANDQPLDARETNFGVGHLRAGYRSAKTHVYGDLGYGLSDNGRLFELLGGLSYRFTPQVSAFGEYRSSYFKGDGRNDRYNDFRIGLGFAL